MKLFVCLDEAGGMTFNKRRQSSDRVIRKDMLDMIDEAKLFVNAYTAKQFTEEESGRLTVDENCLLNAGDEDFVFVENLQIGGFADKVQQIVVYRWQRKYPADFFFDADVTSEDWQLVVSEEIVGHSHECIGKEVYIRKERENA